MVKEYLRPRTPEEALALLRGREDSCLLSGGTYLLSSQFSGEPMTLISLSGILPDKVRPQGNGIALGANMTFSALLETSGLPPALLDAARSMGNRNIRNRATVGGNVGADKSCSSLIPFFIVSQASYARIDMQPVAAEDWETMAAECRACACGPDRGIVSEVVIPTQEGRQIAFDRFGRVAGDISIVTCAVSAELDAGRR
ncbi:MAG: FAD binding domain-containing protein, partial [Spirochaetaceae bacterium]|nr:FAD binding domain-containing protein [Spirochaetaceae bacterium]